MRLRGNCIRPEADRAFARPFARGFSADTGGEAESPPEEPVLPSFKAVGTPLESLTGGSVSWPAHVTGDYGVLYVVTANEAISFTDDGGFVELAADSPQGVGTAAAAAAARLGVFTCEAISDAMPDVVIPDIGNVVLAYIVTYQDVDLAAPVHATAGNTAASNTAVSIPGDTTTEDNCLVVAAVASTADTPTPQLSGWTNASLSDLAERINDNTDLGSGVGLGVADGGLATAGPYDATTATLAASSVQARISFALKGV